MLFSGRAVAINSAALGAVLALWALLLPNRVGAGEITVADIRSLSALQDRADGLLSYSHQTLGGLVSNLAGTEVDRFCLSELSYEAELTEERLVAIRRVAIMETLASPKFSAEASSELSDYLTDQIAKWPGQRRTVEDLAAMCAHTPFVPNEAKQLLGLLNDANVAISAVGDHMRQKGD